ncbi:MAG: RIP metalloprotease RseP [Rhodobacteraceae bacterium]|nr:RIP metalloprotease RseP [Paracoccaceae bacterium]
MGDIIAILKDVPFSVAAFLIAVSIVVFVHEAGHYIAARLSGISVLVFSIGFGRPLLRARDRHGTIWQIAAIPIGGFVRFAEPNEQENAGKQRYTALTDAPLRHRIFTVFAGPLANFLLAAAIFSLFAAADGIVGEDATIDSVRPMPGSPFGFARGDRIIAVDGQQVDSLPDFYRIAVREEFSGNAEYAVQRDGSVVRIVGPHPFPPIVTSVRPSSPAATAGLKRGDVIQAVNGRPIHSFPELGRLIQSSGGVEILLSYWRDGEDRQLRLAGQSEDIPLPGGGFERRVLIGVSGGSFFTPETLPVGPISALQSGIQQTATIISGTVNGIVSMIKGQISGCNIQGPIGIAEISADAAAQGSKSFIQLIAFLSVAIGFINLLPIPALDGGHLGFYLYEALSGRPPSPDFTRYATLAGIVVIVMLMGFGLLNDLTCP